MRKIFVFVNFVIVVISSSTTRFLSKFLLKQHQQHVKKSKIVMFNNFNHITNKYIESTIENQFEFRSKKNK